MTEYDFHDGSLLGKAMKRISESGVQYYIDAERMVRIRWNKRWIPYSEAVEIWPKEFAIT